MGGFILTFCPDPDMENIHSRDINQLDNSCKSQTRKLWAVLCSQIYFHDFFVCNFFELCLLAWYGFTLDLNAQKKYLAVTTQSPFLCRCTISYLLLEFLLHHNLYFCFSSQNVFLLPITIYKWVFVYLVCVSVCISIASHLYFGFIPKCISFASSIVGWGPITICRWAIRGKLRAIYSSQLPSLPLSLWHALLYGDWTCFVMW